MDNASARFLMAVLVLSAGIGGADQFTYGQPVPAAILSAVGAHLQADPKLTAQLANTPTLILDRYSMRLPAGYIATPSVSEMLPEGWSAVAYSSRPNQDGSRATIAITIAPVPQSMVDATPLPADLVRAAAISTGKVKAKLWLSCHVSAVERGQTIGDIPFARVYYSGLSYRQGGSVSKEQHGFTYVGDDDGTIIWIVATDCYPYSDKSMPLAEAAALTFKRR